MSISVDIAEPSNIVELLKQSVEVEVLPLNIEGFPDYYFVSADGVSISVEREPVSACLANPAHIENEIRKHLLPEGRMLLIVEGIPIPNPDGIAVCELIGTYLRAVWLTKMRYEAFIAWLWQLRENGIDYLQTMDWKQTATAIVAIYNNCQKAEHKTMKRSFKELLAWHPDPVVNSLMGITNAGLGEKRATLLAEKFGSLYNAITAPKDELVKILKPAATEKFLKAIGREGG